MGRANGILGDGAKRPLLRGRDAAERACEAPEKGRGWSGAFSAPMSRRALLASAAALAGLAGAAVLAGCSGSGVRGSSWGDCSTRLDGSALSFEGGRASYRPWGKVARTGLDVSEHQGIIDWDAVASDGVDFAFVRLGNRGNTEGNLFLDNYVSYNLEGARAAGLEVHAYFFSQATTADEAAEEAAFAVDTAADNGLAGCYLAYDLEPVSGRTLGMSSDAMAEAADAFCEYVESCGYRPMLYGNRGDLVLFGEEACARWPVWLAQYTEGNPESPCDFAVWQYASDGVVAGVPAAVDLNIWVP